LELLASSFELGVEAAPRRFAGIYFLRIRLFVEPAGNELRPIDVDPNKGIDHQERRRTRSEIAIEESTP
jgi:hypothetical protein